MSEEYELVATTYMDHPAWEVRRTITDESGAAGSICIAIFPGESGRGMAEGFLIVLRDDQILGPSTR